MVVLLITDEVSKRIYKDSRERYPNHEKLIMKPITTSHTTNNEKYQIRESHQQYSYLFRQEVKLLELSHHVNKRRRK